MSATSSRRRFLGTALAAGASPFLLPSGLRAQAGGPNSRLTMGFIGLGTQGRGLLGGFVSRRKDVQVVAICDVDTARRENGMRSVREAYGKDQPAGGSDVAGYKDFRELLARKDIDAVCIATPDHWHAIIATAAANAGKDIYLEKPLTETVDEAKALVVAVGRNQRILQTGSMQRSMREFRVACELVRNGVIGKLDRVEASFGGPGKWCDLPEQAAEPGLDWDLWLGPAPLRPYHSDLAPRGVHTHFPNWRNYREYGGGMITDWGAHHLDIAQWGLGEDNGGPCEVIPAGKEGATEGGTLVYRSGVPVHHKRGEWGVNFFGAAGEVHVDRGRFELILGGKPVARFRNKDDGTALPVELGKAEKEFLKDARIRLYDSRNHQQDFIDCVRSRKPPVPPVESGARSVIACHLLGFSYYYGKRFKWDPVRADFPPGEGDRKWLGRDYRGDWKVG